MDLLDLIADSKTDSLPPGFLRSIKIKYRQEASHVFPQEAMRPVEKETVDRGKSAASDKSTPSFMEWQVPSRLLTRPQAPVPKTPASGILSESGERAKLSSRLSAMTLKSVGTIAIPPDTKQQLPRLGSVESARKSSLRKRKPSLPKIQSPLKMKEHPEPISREKSVSMSTQGKRIINSILTEIETQAKKSSSDSDTIQAVDKWLATATDQEREVALKFFSTLAGSKAELLKGHLTKYHTHIEGSCNYCDGDRINKTLDNLAKGDMGAYFKSKNIHKKEPNLANKSFYQHPRLASRVRRSYQTWHHLPVYNYSHGVANKSSMFTQPHKYIDRHFSIHPEWGLHARLKPAAS